MDLGLRDRVYIVTGGGRGLGRASVDLLVAEGALVVVSGRSEDTLRALADEHGDRVVVVAADNADPETPQRLVAAATAAWGRVDGALISVGGPPPGTIMGTSDADWSRSFESVFLGAVRIARAVAEHVQTGGSIAFVLSSSVKSPIPGLGVSNGLRPGLAMVAKSLADELGSRGIRVNGLLPGRVGTERVAELDAASGDADAAKQAALRTIPLGRYGEPEEFAAAAAFLLGDASSFITGVMLPVDGGMLRSL